jgi:hypothetical protein
MKRNNYSHKLRCEGYVELICRCFSNDVYTKLTCIKNFVWRDHQCLWKGSHDDCVSDP